MGALGTYLGKLFGGIWYLLESLSVTTGRIFRLTNTEQYPEERPVIFPRSRNMIRLLYDQENGRFKCTACQLCAQACPNRCIEVKGERNVEGKMAMTSFQLDFSTCIFCGECVLACRFDALTFQPEHFEMAVLRRSDLLMDKEGLKWVRPPGRGPWKGRVPAGTPTEFGKAV
jgi:NADH-quinone oxidoreductase subunit I